MEMHCDNQTAIYVVMDLEFHELSGYVGADNHSILDMILMEEDSYLIRLF